MTTIDAAPGSDPETVELVRALTGYSDTQDELPDARAHSLIDIVKLQLYNAAGVDEADIYDDAGLAQALLAGVAIKAKCQVENYSVTSWSVADQSVDVSGVRSDDAVQLQQWAELHMQGLQASPKTSLGDPSNTLAL